MFPKCGTGAEPRVPGPNSRLWGVPAVAPVCRPQPRQEPPCPASARRGEDAHNSSSCHRSQYAEHMCLSQIAQHPVHLGHLALLVLKVPLKGQAKPTGVAAGLKLLQKDLQGK